MSSGKLVSKSCRMPLQENVTQKPVRLLMNRQPAVFSRGILTSFKF